MPTFNMKKIIGYIRPRGTRGNSGSMPSSAERLKDLETQSYFHGNTSSRRAESLLVKYGETGSFLVRESDQNTVVENGELSKKYALSFRDSKSVKHFRIKEENGKFFFETASNNKRFISIPLLVSYYQTRKDKELRLEEPCIIDEGLEPFEIKRERIKRTMQIGKGSSSIVFKGFWNGMPVALKEHQSDNDSIRKELDILKKIDHQKVVGFYGFYQQTPSISLVLELMKTNLKTYLRKTEILPPAKQLQFALDITEGMRYLENHRIVHRDLAARNILISANDELKISDFGLAVTLDQDQEYFLDDEVKITFKWAAREVLLDSKFSLKSDVWSFGVTLYEICSKASEPFGNMDPSQLPQMYESNPNFYLSQPNGCEDKMYQIMKSCWREDPLERLTFDGLHVAFEEYNQPTFAN